MYTRRRHLCRAVFLLAVLSNSIVLAADVAGVTRVHKGTVVAVSADKLVAQGLSGKKKEHTYTVSPTASVTCEGEPCKLTDLKGGEQVSLTVEKQQDGSAIATKIEAQQVNK